MRCPKCNFTSFDNFVTCDKCGRDLSEIVGQLHGTSLKVESPFFLESALKAPADKETFEERGGIEGIGLGVDQEVDFSQAADTGAEDFSVAEETTLESEPGLAEEEPSSAAALSDEVEMKQQMETVVKETVAEIKPETTAEGGGESAGKTGLNFDGLDLSDLSPADDLETTEGEFRSDEERPLDLWSLDTSAENDLADLFDDLIPAGNTPEQGTGDEEQLDAEADEGGDPAEPAATGDAQPDKDES